MARPTPRRINTASIHSYSAFFHQRSSCLALLRERAISLGEETSSRGLGDAGFGGECEQEEETIKKIMIVIEARIFLGINNRRQNWLVNLKQDRLSSL